MGNKAFVFDPIPSRIYPQKNLFSHILGQTDDINVGISGVEKFFDKDLSNKKKIEIPLSLTVDSNLQYLIRKELIKAESDFNNIGSGAILMNVENGEILSLVSLPDYDLNQRASITDNIYTNKITLGVYELGSVFKTFTIAAGLENKAINSNTVSIFFPKRTLATLASGIDDFVISLIFNIFVTTYDINTYNTMARVSRYLFIIIKQYFP